jgi:hypothetical protein
MVYCKRLYGVGDVGVYESVGVFGGESLNVGGDALVVTTKTIAAL